MYARLTRAVTLTLSTLYGDTIPIYGYIHARLTRAVMCSNAQGVHARLCAMLSMKNVDIT